jgi:DNA primase
MIPQSFIEEVQSRTDITEVISSYIPLKRAGRNFKAICPFHGEKTPSFIVSPQKQIFHCFGCGQGGGVFRFLTLIEKVTFPEAVEMLAKRLGLAIPYQKDKTAKTKNFLYEVMDKAASFFHATLRDEEGRQAIRTYLEKRGIGTETIKQFRLGFAAGNNCLLQYMRKSGFTLEALEKASLAVLSGGSFRDLFHDRITFPIFDIRSRIVGFGARLWKELPNAPKYINSLENVLYSKREHLFGLNFSKEDVIKKENIIIVEGYLDMIVLFMRGVKNIAASLGTALTLEQIRLIKRYASSVTLVYDSDKAGQAATLRSIDLLLENDLKAEVVNLPEGYDPDSLVREKGKDFFLNLLAQKRDFFDYKLDNLKKIYDTDSIEGKTKTTRDMLVTLDKLSSEIQKYGYISKLAASLKVKEEIMIAEFQNSFPKKSNAPRRMPASAAYQDRGLNLDKEPLSVTEKVLLKFMFTNPKAFSAARKNLKGDYFQSHLAQKTVSFLFNRCSAAANGSLQNLLRSIDDKEISSFVSRILMDEDIPSDKNLFKESLIKLKKKSLIEAKKKLKGRIKSAEAGGDRQKVKELMKEYSRINSEVRNG